MITTQMYGALEYVRRWLIQCTQAVLNVNLSQVNILIVPNDMLLGANTPEGRNPAIYINRNTPPIVIKKWETYLRDYKEEHASEDIRLGQIMPTRVICVRPLVFNTMTLLQRCGIIWHEYGHAYLEAAGRPNTEQNAYLFEVQMLDYACTTNLFSHNGITVTQVTQYLDWRQTQYNIGIQPALTRALGALRTKLAQLAAHRFMTA